jgi:hypothetical protein
MTETSNNKDKKFLTVSNVILGLLIIYLVVSTGYRLLGGG